MVIQRSTRKKISISRIRKCDILTSFFLINMDKKYVQLLLILSSMKKKKDGSKVKQELSVN